MGSPALLGPPPSVLLPHELPPEMLISRQIDLGTLELASLPKYLPAAPPSSESQQSRDVKSSRKQRCSSAPRAPKLHAQQRLEARKMAEALKPDDAKVFEASHPLLVND